MPATQIPPDVLTTFVASETAESRSQLLRSERLLHDPQAVEALCDQANSWAREDPALARKAAAAAVWLAETLAHTPSEGLAHRTLANIFTYLARPSEALLEYNRALEIFALLRDDQQAAITRSSALPTVTDTSGAETAFEWAQKARHVFQKTGDELRLARLENNLAVIFFRQEDFPRALDHWQEAYTTLRRIGETSDEAATLRNLAVCSISLNQPTEAKDYYQRARELCETNNYRFLLHTIDYNIAYLHYLEGDHHKALELYREARSRSRDLRDNYHEALCSLDETEIYIELNLLQEAHTVAQLAETQFRDQQRPYEAAKAMFNLALVFSRQGDPREALQHLDAAAEAFSGQGNLLWPGQVELLRAKIYFSEGRFFEARRSAALAFERFHHSALPRRASLSQLLLAKVDHSLGAIAAAEGLCRSATETFQSLGEPDSLFQAFFILGKILDTEGDRSGAIEAFRRAEQYLMELRERRTVSQMRVSTVDQPLEVYSHLVGLLLTEDNESALSTEMFRLVETAKARSFADLMALSDVRTRTPTTMRSQLVDQVSNLRQELNWLYRRIDRSELQSKTATPSVVESLQAQSQAKERELARTLSVLRTRNPNAEVDPERIGVAKIEAVQALLGDSVLLEFFVSHDIVVALVLSRTQRKMLPVAVVSTVRELQRRLWYYLHHVPSSKEAARRVARAVQPILQELYSELLMPLESFLDGAPLLVAPHGFLFLVPFHALWNGARHLVEGSPVSYVPSATDLSRIATGSALRLEQCGVSDLGPSSEVLGVFPSPHSPKRIQFPGTSTLSGAPGLVTADACAAIHLIAKAELREDNPLFSSIEVGAGSLTFLDLHRSKLLSPLVTIEGEGFAATSPSGHHEVSTLWRALLNSGARTALIPASSGADSAHREHARLLYRALAKGENAASAHRDAMLEMQQNGTPLQEWAGMFLVGDPFLALGADQRTTARP